jgi:hypothetical protein
MSRNVIIIIIVVAVAIMALVCCCCVALGLAFVPVERPLEELGGYGMPGLMAQPMPASLANAMSM